MATIHRAMAYKISSPNGEFSMKVNFNLKQTKIKDESTQIFFSTTIKGERLRLYTGEKIEPKFWDSKKMRAESYYVPKNKRKHCQKVNSTIDYYIHIAESYCDSFDYQDELLEGTKDEFVSYLNEQLIGEKAKDKDSPLVFFEDFVTEKIKTKVNKSTRTFIKEGTQNHHKVVLKRVKGFFKYARLRQSFEVFTDGFGDAFQNYLLKEKKYSHNTVASTFSILKIWLAEAEKKKLITDKSFHSYPTTTLDVDNVALTEDEIDKIYNLDFSDPEIKKQIDNKSNIEQTRDLFVFACWTGLRLGDYRDLSKAVFKDGIMEVITNKTQKKLSIPLHKTAQEILDKYGGTLPKLVDKTHSIRQIRKCGELAGIDGEETIKKNIGGKLVTINAPKYSLLMNHTARRSFATNLYRRGAPTISIMAITGHTSEANFLKYIKVSREEHAKIVKSFWD